MKQAKNPLAEAALFMREHPREWLARVQKFGKLLLKAGWVAGVYWISPNSRLQDSQGQIMRRYS